MKRYALSTLVGLVVLAGISGAQVASGTAIFNSYGGGPFDVVNLGNLNVHFAVPILHKAGRGLPFSYDLSYDSSVWYPVGVSGSQVWTPVSNFGWSSNWGGNSGYLSYSFLQTYCYDNMGHQSGSTSYYQGWAYHDPWTNAFHGFSGYMVIYAWSCSGTNIYSFTSTATDGSGLTLNVNNLSGTITLPSGTVVSPPNGPPTGPVATTKKMIMETRLPQTRAAFSRIRLGKPLSPSPAATQLLSLTLRRVVRPFHTICTMAHTI